MKLLKKYWKALVGIAVILGFFALRGHENGDIVRGVGGIPANSIVYFEDFPTRGNRVALSPTASKAFIDLVSSDAMICKFGPLGRPPAVPNGHFIAGQHTFYLFGRSLMESIDMEGRVWKAPWLRHLEEQWMIQGLPMDPEVWKSKLEQVLTGSVTATNAPVNGVSNEPPANQ